MTTEQQRKEFEEWISAEPYLYSVERWPRFHVNHGDYVTLDVRVAWAAWQQSALLAGKDSERLDWLEKHHWQQVEFRPPYRTQLFLACENNADWINDLRAAIDAAMKATNQGEAK